MYELKCDYFNSLYDPNNIKQVLHRCGAEGLTLAEVVMEPVDEALLELVDVADQHGGEVGVAEVRGAAVRSWVRIWVKEDTKAAVLRKMSSAAVTREADSTTSQNRRCFRGALADPKNIHPCIEVLSQKLTNIFIFSYKYICYLCTANAYKQTYER